MNNLSNQEYLFLNKKWNDFSSIAPAISVHQPAGKAAAVQAKVSDEKFVKSFDCFATSFRSFHFVSFEASECKWIKGRIKGIFFQDKHKWKYRIDRDFKWFSPLNLSNVPWQLACYCNEQKVWFLEGCCMNEEIYQLSSQLRFKSLLAKQQASAI